MYRNKVIISLFLLLCFTQAFAQSENYKQMRLFNKLWKKIDRHYASFEIIGINWQESYSTFRRQITPDLNQDQLLDVLEQMLKPFDDGHVGVAKLKLFPLRLG